MTAEQARAIVYDARQQVTKMVCAATSKPDRITDLASAIDNMNGAWERYVLSIAKERDERARLIDRLLDELAELRK